MYFDINKLENYIPAAIFTELLKKDYYSQIEADILRDMDITDLTVEPLEWQYMPAAFIAAYIASNKFNNLSKEVIDRITANYTKAIQLVALHKVETPVNINAKFVSSGVITSYEGF
jgi:hypothetical protein